MYNNNQQLISAISEEYNIADEAAPNGRIEIYLYNRETKLFAETPIVLPNVTSITLDRRFDMVTNQLNFSVDNKDGVYSPNYNIVQNYTNLDTALYPSGYSGILKPFAHVAAYLGYGDDSELTQVFTGKITDVDISDDANRITVKCLDLCHILSNIIRADKTTVPELIYTNLSAVNIMHDLFNRCGFTHLKHETDIPKKGALTYKVLISSDKVGDAAANGSEIKFPINTTYMSAIKAVLSHLDYRMYCNRFGVIIIDYLRNLDASVKQDDLVPSFYFDDALSITSAQSHYSSLYIYNTVLVRTKTFIMQYINKELLNDSNNEMRPHYIQMPWIDGKLWGGLLDLQMAEKSASRKIAKNYFNEILNYYKQTSAVIKGNPSIDIGDVASVKSLISAVNEKQVVTACSTTLTSSGYTEKIDFRRFFYTETTTKLEEHLLYTFVVENPKTGTEEEESPKYALQSSKNKALKKALASVKKNSGIYYEWGGALSLSPNSNNAYTGKTSYGDDSLSFISGLFQIGFKRPVKLEPVNVISKFKPKLVIALNMDQELQITDFKDGDVIIFSRLDDDNTLNYLAGLVTDLFDTEVNLVGIYQYESKYNDQLITKDISRNMNWKPHKIKYSFKVNGNLLSKLGFAGFVYSFSQIASYFKSLRKVNDKEEKTSDIN